MTELDLPAVTGPAPPEARRRLWHGPRRRTGGSGWAGGLRQPLVTGAVGLLLAVLAWTTTPGDLEPTDVIDFDYRGALQWAAVHHTAFGSHFVFTYGPLGFLSWPTLFFGAPAALGFVALTVLDAAVGAVVFSFFRARTSAAPAVLLAYLVVVLVAFGLAVDCLVPLSLVWGARLVGRTGRRTELEWVLAGSLTSIAGLVKVSLGPPILVVFVCAWALRQDRSGREAAGWVAGLAAAFVTVWSLTGNSLLAVVSWVRLSLQLITGYSAMAYEFGDRTYFYWLAGLGALAVLVGAAQRGRAEGGRWRVAGWVVMALVPLESAFREAFVRHDAHDVLFFAELPLLLIAVAAPAGQRRALAWQPSTVVAAALLEVVAIGTVPSVVARPVTAVHDWLSTGRAVVVASERARLETSARTALQDIYRLPPQWLAELRGQRVAAAPRGQPMAWTYPQLEWAPMPTIQEYTAYTPALDRLDADFFAAPTAPRWVLQQPFGLDDRNPVWDAPAAELALRCHYRPVGTSPFLTLLARGANRCGPARLQAVLRTSLGRTVTIPAPAAGQALSATISISPSLLGRVAGLLFKGATYSVIVDGRTTYRYVAGTGGSPHLLTFPLYGGTTLAVPATTSLRFASNDPWASATAVTVRVSTFAVR